MCNSEIIELVDEIQNVNFKEFWYGSKLLEKVKQFKNKEITKALALRHHFLQNKKAGSCYVIRHAIKETEGPYFNTLWDMIFSNDYNESDASSFILAEIGGIWTFQKILNLLREKKVETYSILIPCLSHLINRYYDIIKEEEPTMQIMDVQTQSIKTVKMKNYAPDIYQRTINDRHLSNELFKLTTNDRIIEMSTLLDEIPATYFGRINKAQFINAIENLKVK